MARPMNLLAALRQLACQGLPGKAALPEALGLLRQLVGFDSEVAVYVDERHRLVDMHVPPHVDLAHVHLYASHFYDRPDDEIVATRRHVVDGSRRVMRLSDRLGRAAMERTELWDRVLRPYEMGWTCLMPLHDGPRPLACLMLTRPFARHDFKAPELRLLEQAQPWLNHAIAGAPADAAEPPSASEAVESGMLILDGAGQLVHSSAGALRLLHLAMGEPLTAHRPGHVTRGQAEGLWRRLSQAAFAAATGHGTVLPAGSVRNAHGYFGWRAYALDAHVPGAGTHVALHVERRLPLAAQLFRAPRFLALPARERDVALALAHGRSREQTAAALGIAPSSVIHATRSLYRRLNVSQAQDVAAALLRPA